MILITFIDGYLLFFEPLKKNISDLYLFIALDKSAFVFSAIKFIVDLSIYIFADPVVIFFGMGQICVGSLAAGGSSTIYRILVLLSVKKYKSTASSCFIFLALDFSQPWVLNPTQPIVFSHNSFIWSN